MLHKLLVIILSAQLSIWGGMVKAPEQPSIENDVEMLAAVIYQEAGGDACCDACRRRVGDVVLNRVADERFPDSIEAVLTQRGQYGMEGGVRWPSRAQYAGEQAAVERARRIARELLEDTQHSELYGKGYVWQAAFSQGTDNVTCCGTVYGR